MMKNTENTKTKSDKACGEMEKSDEQLEKSFVGRVSDYGSKTIGRKHIEVPKPKRNLYKPGDFVKVTPVE